MPSSLLTPCPFLPSLLDTGPPSKERGRDLRQRDADSLIILAPSGGTAVVVLQLQLDPCVLFGGGGVGCCKAHWIVVCRRSSRAWVGSITRERVGVIKQASSQVAGRAQDPDGWGKQSPPADDQ